MARILGGEIRWADLDPVVGNEQAGRRPVLILSDEKLHQKLNVAIVMAITSQGKDRLPLEYRLPAGLLPKESWVKLYQIRTLALKRVGSRIAVLPTEHHQEISQLLLKLVEP
jgi:mRNA interferase MazF